MRTYSASDVANYGHRDPVHRLAEPTHYFGIDINQNVLDAGYDKGLMPQLRAKLPHSNPLS